MSNDIKVSVLVPVYGVEKYIERCARSLFEQTMTHGIEFIFTDDCTPDNSIQILQSVINQYPARKGQIKILHHDVNIGLAAARVTGVNAASGEYVIHCDSDDWVESDMYEQMYTAAKRSDADIAVCGFFNEYATKQQRVIPAPNVTSRDLVIDSFNARGIQGYLWNRLIRRNYYLSGNFVSDPSVSLFEDMMLTIPFHLASSRIAVVSSPLYHYNLSNQASMVHTPSMKHFESGLKVLDMLQPYIVADSEIHHLWRQRRLFFIMPLITSTTIYDPGRWIIEKGDTEGICLSARGRLSAWFVMHGHTRLNLLVQRLLRLIFKK